MTVDDVFSLIKFILNKNQNGGLSPSEFGRIINTAQRSYVSFLLGSFQTYMPGRPISKTELGQNSVVRQRLSPVIYGTVLDVDSNGRSPYPGDYLQTDAMWGIYGRTRIRYVQQDALDSAYNSVIDPIATNPIYLIEDTGFQFFPETQWRARLSYVKNPPDIVWGYTTDGNGRPVYNAATSVDPIWDDTSMLEIIARALRMAGVNLQAADVSNYATEIKQAGQ